MAETRAPAGVVPYLTIEGASRAIDFYRTVFGAQEAMRQMADDGRRVLHCRLNINGGVVMLSDTFPEHSGPAGPDPARASPVALSLALTDPAEVDRLHGLAVEQGARSVMAPMDAVWGARFAMLTDPFGHRWLLNAERQKAG
jgi:PhnB protein